MSLKFNLLIGLECHVKLNYKKKFFSLFKFNSIKNFNKNVSYYDLSMPGILPIISCYKFNKIILFGIFIKSIIFNISKFFRKSYFYPDVAKNYQITQYKQSILKNGGILIYNNYVYFSYYKIINILQCHVEEDTARIIYNKDYSGINYNRSGVILLEIVSNYNLNSFYEVILYIINLQNILKFLELSDCNMEIGNFRFDVNISVRFLNFNLSSYKIELKNLNSFNTLYYIINDELRRQIYIYVNSDIDISHTRGFNNLLNSSFFIRKKELYLDYKYFNDPDLPYLLLNKDLLHYTIFRFKKFLKFYTNILTNFNFIILFLKIRIIKFFILYILLGFYFNKYKSIINFLIISIKFLKISKNQDVKYSFEQILILIKFLNFNFISFNNCKKILNFIFNYNLSNFYLYKIIKYNKLLINYNKNYLIIRINKILLINLILIHNYMYNTKLLNYFINLVNKIYSININFFDLKYIIFVKLKF